MSGPVEQVVVVTGASGGIGRAVAQAFGARGAKVALLARGERCLRGAAEDVEAAAAGLLDRYLGRTGYSSQQAHQPRDPDQPSNLWEPADGVNGRDFGAHGIFDDKSTSRSYQLWASQHKGLLGAVGAGGLLRWSVFVRQVREVGQAGSWDPH